MCARCANRRAIYSRAPHRSGNTMARSATRRRVLQWCLTGSTVGVGGCIGAFESGSSGTSQFDSATAQDAVRGWRDTTLTDVRTGRPFTISELAETPVYLEFFAAWCPVCTRQQRHLRGLKERVGAKVRLVSLNTDPNEDADRIREYRRTHGFDWQFAVVPAPMSRALKDEFGTIVVVPSQTPVAVVCPDETAQLLPRGVLTVDHLEAQLTTDC